MMFTCIECEENYDYTTGDVDERTCYNCIDGIREHGMLDEDEYICKGEPVSIVGSVPNMDKDE